QFEKELGRDFQLNQLTSEYDAVFLGLGLGPDSSLKLSGEDHPRVQGAVDFISKLKNSTFLREISSLDSIQTALVIGGGNTALDTCRELKGLGIPQVLVSYRRSEKE